ncbi:hypothetical protein KFK09_008522 [Dendrobium nobile]|uniref:Uncharacterized protein n=1 Tax=Dendrobium nobile TaxID=94219 RepID=A0A8T3BKA7_DENNO|nr:hypothetical protein KFK09_008522 [Dendrobium nobile]
MGIGDHLFCKAGLHDDMIVFILKRVPSLFYWTMMRGINLFGSLMLIFSFGWPAMITWAASSCGWFDTACFPKCSTQNYGTFLDALICFWEADLLDAWLCLRPVLVVWQHLLIFLATKEGHILAADFLSDACSVDPCFPESSLFVFMLSHFVVILVRFLWFLPSFVFWVGVLL